MGYVNFSELRANMAQHFDKLEQDRDELVITRQGREEMVLMPLRELESLRETMHQLSNPANAAMLRESIAQLDAGHGIEVDLEALLAFADKINAN